MRDILLFFFLFFFLSSAFRFPPQILRSSSSLSTKSRRGHHTPLHYLNMRRCFKLNENAIEKGDQTTVGTGLLTPKNIIIGGIGLITFLAILNINHIRAFDAAVFIESTIAKISSLGVYGYFYFALVYIAAEILVIPAFALTASSGYLFGLIPGTLIVLISATIAATISFYIGRTLLRDWALKKTEGNQRWKTIDKVIEKEGFKVILLLRLSPLFPFALSNYLYGITSVDFGSYISATILGFAPGTLGIVYAGSAGKALTSGQGMGGLPWYGYALLGVFIGWLGKTIAKVATDSIAEIEKEAALDRDEAKSF